MPFRTEGLGVDAGLMSFIQDTKRDTFRNDCWHVATKVPVKEGDHYWVDVEMQDRGGWGMRVAKLKIKRRQNGGNFVIEKGCQNIIISDPCYIIGDDLWSEFCDALYANEQTRKTYPIFMEHCGVNLVVSSSGYGDGFYNCNIEIDDDGNLIEAAITFIGDENEELEEPWEDGEDDLTDEELDELDKATSGFMNSIEDINHRLDSKEKN